MAAGVDPGGISSDWIDRIWLDPRRRVTTDGGPPGEGGGLLTGLGLGAELGLLLAPPSAPGLGAELGLLLAPPSAPGDDGEGDGGIDGGRTLAGTAGIGPVLCAR